MEIIPQWDVKNRFGFSSDYPNTDRHTHTHKRIQEINTTECAKCVREAQEKERYMYVVGRQIATKYYFVWANSIESS